MKKLLYSLAVAFVGIAALTGCTTFDDEHSEHYGEGPAVTINLTETKDNSFTFTVNPAEGTNYYAYTVVEGDEAKDVSEDKVLKKTMGGVSEAIVNYSKAAATTVNMLNAKGEGICSPNTSYVIYAVAANANGITGKVKALVVKTTDGDAPTLKPYEAGDPSAETTATFSEPVFEGEGTVSAQYYQEWGDGELIDVPADKVHATINGANVTFTVDDVPAGAYVLYSWTEGAFKDSFGNKCPAENTVIGEEGFVGVWNRQPLKPFAIEAKQFAPASGGTIGEYDKFTGVITFAFDVFRNDIEESDDCVKTGDLSLTYSNAKRTTTINLDPSDWSVSGKTVTFKMPEAAAEGDKVTLKIKAGVIMDINGNGNEAFASTDVAWRYDGFTATAAMLEGNYTLTYYSAREKKEVTNAVTITKATTNNEDGTKFVISGLYAAGSQVGAVADYANNRLYIKPGYGVDTYDNKGISGFIITISASNAEAIECKINKDGSITTSDLALAVYVEGEGVIGTLDKLQKAKFVKTTSAAKAKSRRAARK